MGSAGRLSKTTKAGCPHVNPNPIIVVQSHGIDKPACEGVSTATERSLSHWSRRHATDEEQG